MTATITTFDEKASIRDVASTLKRDGAVIIERLTSEQLMDDVYKEVETNVAPADLESNTDLWPPGNKTIGGLAEVSPLFADRLLAHPKILDLADAVLLPITRMGPSANELQEEKDTEKSSRDSTVSVAENYEGSNQVIFRKTNAANCNYYQVGATLLLELCGPDGKNQVLHRENANYQPFIESLLPNMPEIIMSVIWAGTDFTVENGATRLVPGSHEWPEERVALEHEITQAVMPKGSAVIWLSRSLHGSGASKSSEGRVGYFHSYIVDWLRQEENQYLSVPAEAARLLPLASRQLLGYRASKSLGWVKGRDQEDLLAKGVSGNI